MKLRAGALAYLGENMIVVTDPASDTAHIVAPGKPGEALCSLTLAREWPWTGGYLIFFDSAAFTLCPACERRLRELVGAGNVID